MACEEDDDTKKNETQITGDWTLVSRAATGCESIEDNDTTVLECTNIGCITYSFNIIEDSTSTTQSFLIATQEGSITTNTSGEYRVSDNKLSFCVEEEGEDDELTCTDYSMNIKGTTLTLTRKDSESSCTETLLLEQKME